jgi:hypothetical protein
MTKSHHSDKTKGIKGIITMIDLNPNERHPNDMGKVYIIRVNIKLVLGILFIFSGLLMFIVLYLPVRNQGRYELIFLSLIFIASGYTYLKQWYLNHGATIQITGNGLIFTDKHSNTTSIKWTDIAEIKQSILKYHFWLFIVPTKNYEYNMITINGYSLNIDNRVKDYEELVKIIQDNAYMHIYNRLKNIYDQGGDIKFGKFEINKSGIKKGSETTSWKDIRNIEAIDGNIYINKKERVMSWETTPVLDVANYLVLIPMINQILKDPTGIQ